MDRKRKRFLSINRFERKKCIELAIKAFKMLGNSIIGEYQLVIAGILISFIE